MSEPIEDPREMEIALRHYLRTWQEAYEEQFPEQHKKLRGWRIDFRIVSPDFIWEPYDEAERLERAERQIEHQRENS